MGVLKNNLKMRRLALLMIVGALLSSPIQSRAAPYYLTCNLVDPGKKNPRPSKSPKRPLVVELVEHTLTLPEQVIGCTLELKNEEGEVDTYFITDTVFTIPQELDGTLGITISNGESIYQGTIEVHS